MKLGRRLPPAEEREDTAIDSMMLGTIDGFSKVGMPIDEVVRVPLVPSAGSWCGTAPGGQEVFGLSGTDFHSGGVVDTASGIERDTAYSATTVLSFTESGSVTMTATWTFRIVSGSGTPTVFGNWAVFHGDISEASGSESAVLTGSTVTVTIVETFDVEAGWQLAVGMDGGGIGEPYTLELVSGSLCVVMS